MTREEIKQEAEERVNICTPYHTGSFIQGYIAGAEPRENKIADIKANCDLAIEGRDVKIMELERKLEQTEKDLADYQFNYPSIKKLEQENNKLLDVINGQDVKIADLEKQNKKLQDRLELYKKAFCVFVNWADECDFGYDNIPDAYEKYKGELEKIGYIEGLMYIALKEVKNNDFDYIKREVENVDKVF